MSSLRVIAAVAASLVVFNPQLVTAKCATQETYLANVDQTNDDLLGVAGSSASDAWAVGYTNDFVGGSPYSQLLEHFDGTQWSIVTPPHSLSNAYLAGVSARVSNDVWAVGTDKTETFGKPLNEHWDGSSWKAVRGPSNPHGFFVEVSAVSSNPALPNDVWAVGTFWNKDFYEPVSSFAEHWDGRTWTSAGLDNVPGVQLFDVATVSDGDAWAVGSNTCARGCRAAPIIVHWDGTQWNVSNGAFNYRGVLFGVSAISSQDVWAIGSWAPAGRPSGSVIEHFDGQSWKFVPWVNPGNGAELNSISAVSPTDVWAAGSYRSPFSPNVTLALLEHWNGTSWKIVPAPSAHIFNEVNAISDISGSPIAVGNSAADGTFQQVFFKTFGFTVKCQ